MQAIAIIYLYVIGLISLHAIMRDLNPNQTTTREWMVILFWPLTIPAALISGLYDAWRGR